VLSVLTSDRFIDKSVAQTWATLLDEGTYLCSRSTMHRILRANDAAGERRAQATHPPRVKPELVATRPGQVWSWDITKLRGPRAWGVLRPVRRARHLLPLRRGVDRRRLRGLGQIAKSMLEEAMGVHGIPDVVHADRGTSMTSKPVAQLLVDLSVTRSHSRPHVSNDNPYSEAAFKTLKYAPVFPGEFGSLADARAFCETFFGYYNHEHRHCRDRAAHPGLGPLRHRDRGPRPAAGHPRRRLRRPPRPLRPPPAGTTETAHRRVDQPALTGGPHTKRLTADVSNGLTPSELTEWASWGVAEVVALGEWCGCVSGDVGRGDAQRIG
jgi:putative transposase